MPSNTANESCPFVQEEITALCVRVESLRCRVAALDEQAAELGLVFPEPEPPKLTLIRGGNDA